MKLSLKDQTTLRAAIKGLSYQQIREQFHVSAMTAGIAARGLGHVNAADKETILVEIRRIREKRARTR